MCDSCIGCCVGSTDRHRHSISRVRYCRQGRHGCLETPIPQREGRVGYSLRLALPPSLLPFFSLSFILFSLFCYFYHSTILSSRLCHLPSPLPFSSFLFSSLISCSLYFSPLLFLFLPPIVTSYTVPVYRSSSPIGPLRLSLRPVRCFPPPYRDVGIYGSGSRYHS